MKLAVITAIIGGTIIALACIAKFLSLFGVNLITALAFVLCLIAIVSAMLALICVKYVVPSDEAEEDDPDDGDRKLLAA